MIVHLPIGQIILENITSDFYELVDPEMPLLISVSSFDSIYDDMPLLIDQSTVVQQVISIEWEGTLKPGDISAIDTLILLCQEKQLPQLIQTEIDNYSYARNHKYVNTCNCGVCYKINSIS